MNPISLALAIVGGILGVVYAFVPDHRIAAAGIVSIAGAIILPTV